MFRVFVSAVLTRRNTITGVLYKWGWKVLGMLRVQ